MEMQGIEIKIYYDPMLDLMAEEIYRDVVWAGIAKKFAQAENVCVSQFVRGAVFCYPTDDFLEAFYNHKASTV